MSRRHARPFGTRILHQHPFALPPDGLAGGTSRGGLRRLAVLCALAHLDAAHADQMHTRAIASSVSIYHGSTALHGTADAPPPSEYIKIPAVHTCSVHTPVQKRPSPDPSRVGEARGWRLVEQPAIWAGTTASHLHVSMQRLCSLLHLRQRAKTMCSPPRPPITCAPPSPCRPLLPSTMPCPAIPLHSTPHHTTPHHTHHAAR